MLYTPCCSTDEVMLDCQHNHLKFMKHKHLLHSDGPLNGPFESDIAKVCDMSEIAYENKVYCEIKVPSKIKRSIIAILSDLFNTHTDCLSIFAESRQSVIFNR